MRRYAVSFAISVLAFVTGLFSVYLFLLLAGKVQNDAPTVTTNDLVDFSVPNKRSLHQETGIESLISDKEKALLLFEPTLEKWINKEKIAEIIEPSPEIIERIAATRLHRYEAPYLTRMARRSYKPSLLNLNGDRKPELAIMINCAEPAGCELWIFREVKGDFEVILRTTWELEKFVLKKTRSKGFFDIQTSYYPNDPNSETLKSMDDYKFDGEKYYHSGCSAHVNRYRDANGGLRLLRKPIFQRYDDCC